MNDSHRQDKDLIPTHTVDANNVFIMFPFFLIPSPLPSLGGWPLFGVDKPVEDKMWG